jgi:hypothetical protein
MLPASGKIGLNEEVAGRSICEGVQGAPGAGGGAVELRGGTFRASLFTAVLTNGTVKIFRFGPDENSRRERWSWFADPFGASLDRRPKFGSGLAANLRQFPLIHEEELFRK